MQQPDPGSGNRGSTSGRSRWIRTTARVAMFGALLVAGNALYAEQRTVAAVAAAVAAALAIAAIVSARRSSSRR